MNRLFCFAGKADIEQEIQAKTHFRTMRIEKRQAFSNAR